MNPFTTHLKLRPQHRLLLAVLGLAALVAGLARAAVPPGLPAGLGIPEPIPYRGVLEQNGAPVTRESVPMDFALFIAADATTPVWGESKAVNVVGGRFSVQLGDTTPIAAALLDQAELYLAVTVDGQPLVGRQRLLTAPYAHRAGSAWTFRSRDITNDLVPPGTIVAFGGVTAPAGWLACDGAVVATSAYPALYAAIGATWGSPGAGQFSLPDLRGVFIRGADEGAGQDPDTGRQVGSIQGWATNVDTLFIGGDGAHDHSAAPNSQGKIPYGLTYTGTGTVSSGSDNSAGEPNIYSYWKIDGAPHAHAIQGGAPETRPLNKAVKYIIKY